MSKNKPAGDWTSKSFRERFGRFAVSLTEHFKYFEWTEKEFQLLQTESEEQAEDLFYSLFYNQWRDIKRTDDVKET